jgi:hypothetical protein
MKNHLKILGVVYTIFGIICGGVAFFFIRTAAAHGPILGVSSIINSIAGFRSVLALLFTITCLPAIIAGVGLLLEWRWAKPVVQILGFLNLVNIPLGTIVGIYTIWALTREEAGKPWDPRTDSEPLPPVFPPYR